MKKYIVSADLEIEAESAEGAFEEAMKHLDYDEVLQNATVAEPYLLDEPLPESVAEDGSIARY